MKQASSEMQSALHLPAALIIMDGFGLSDSSEDNAISCAHTPCLDELFSHCSWTKLTASGEAVGLPEGQMGNSEVGHLTIGAGRVMHQELTRITRACCDGSLEKNNVLHEAFEKAKNSSTVLHCMGLLSDGGVHSTNQHLYALLRYACAMKVPEVRVHCFMDGRDVPPSSGVQYLQELEQVIEDISNEETHISIGSIEGRYYAMDRDMRWDRVEHAYEAIMCAQPTLSVSPQTYLEQSYHEGITDEFVLPASFDARGVCEGDVVLFFNFRPDRAREITHAIVDNDFTGFERDCWPAVHYVCLTEYDPTIKAPVAFEKEFPQKVLAEVLADAGLRQYHIAETEKYAHVTFFLNGGVEKPQAGEKRVLIPSPRVSTYDLQPEMSEPEVAKTLVDAIDANEADVYIVNFANCDMVGHTGNLSAAIKAVEAVDRGLSEVLAALKRKEGTALLTADHGNADKMFDLVTKTPFTAHTTAPVPLLLIDYSGRSLHLRKEVGALSNIAPTLLDSIGLPIPQEMTAESFLAKR